MRFLTLAFLFICFPVCGQELLPFVENFGKPEFGGDNQVWNVAQGQDRALYFANNRFLLRYDGVDWEQYTLPNKTIIRSVFADGNRIYSGSYREFGYWTRHKGKMVYKSLSDGRNLFSGNSNNEEIWKIIKHGEKFYFQSFNDLFVFDGRDASKVRFPSQVSYCYLISGELYVATVNQGVYTLNGNSFIKVKGWEVLTNNVVHHIESHDQVIYAFTKNNGIFYDDGSGMQSWRNPLNDIVKSQVVLSAKFVGKSTLAVGTAVGGLYLLDLSSGKWSNINRQNGLKNNAILSIGVDAENDLWLGLDNGISHVENNSPVSILSDNSGILGSVYAISAGDDGFLFATNHGIFRYSDKSVDAIPNTQGQAWNIFKDRSKYIIGHNDGTFLLEGETARKVNDVTGGWEFLKSRFENVYFQGHYAGIVIYDNPDDMSRFKRIEGLAKPIRQLEQVMSGEIWAADNYRGLYRILYHADFSVKSIENVTENNNITNDFGVKLFRFKNEVLSYIDGKWYRYERSSGKLVIHDSFNRAFEAVSDVIRVRDDEFLVARAGILYRVKPIAETFLWRQIPTKYYAGKLLTGNVRVYSHGDSLMVNLDDGCLVHQQAALRKEDKVRLEVFISNELINNGVKVKYGSDIEVQVIPDYLGYGRSEYYYQSAEGKKRVINGSFRLSNLESGSQQVDVFALDDNNYKKVAEFNFRVGYPWYFSFWMIVLYIGFTASIWLFYYRWNKVRYSQRLKLEQEEMRHNQDLLELRLKAESDMKIQEYERHILELEIQNKSSEVAGKSFSIAKQSEIMETINKILDNESDVNKLKTEIKKTIRVNSINKHEWEAFENNMKQLHHEFVQKLTAAYPQLSSKDIKLSIYLRMNLSSKEIAPLMNISFRGVELHRYRLRKKMGLNPETNLNRFMIAFE